MQSVYRIISRDYKHSYNYFTDNKELFDVVEASDGLGWPCLEGELLEKYGTEDVAEAIGYDFPDPEFPYILLGETTVYDG